MPQLQGLELTLIAPGTRSEGCMPQPQNLLLVGFAVFASGILTAQETGYQDPDCPFFGAQRERYYTDAYRKASGMPSVRHLSATTTAVTSPMGFAPGGSRTYNFGQTHKPGS